MRESEDSPLGEGRIRLWISGRVQGVCFRAYTLEEGRRLGLRGIVRNLPDGRVEVLAQGQREKLKKLEAFCRKGPPYADVRSVEITEEDPQAGVLPPFRISY